MPTVPTSFVPQVADTGASQIVPFEATPGQPMQNLAADQQVKMGAATTDAGNVMFRIGSVIQDKMNEAAAKDADTQMLSSAQELLRGKNGYLTTRGQDADTQFDQAEAALSDRAQSILDGLQNDTQKAMFRGAASRSLVAFKSQMSDHRNQEISKWKISSSIARQDKLVGMAINETASRGMMIRDNDGNMVPDGPFHLYSAAAMRELDERNALMGIPDNSELADLSRRELQTQIVDGVSKRLMSEGNYQAALDFVNQHMSVNNLDTKAGNELANRTTAARNEMVGKITAMRREKSSDELAQSIKETGWAISPSATNNFISPADALRIDRNAPGSLQYTVTPFSTIVAPADGTVIEETQDEKQGHTIVIKFEDGTIGRFSHMDGKNSVMTGQFIPQGNVIGVPGGRRDGNAFFGYLLEKNGKAIDPTSINALTKTDTMNRISTPQTIDNAITIAKNEISDPQLRDATITKLTRLYAVDDQVAREQLERVTSQAANELAATGSISTETAKILPLKVYRELTEKERNYSSPITLAALELSGGQPLDPEGKPFKNADGTVVTLKQYITDQYMVGNLSHSDFIDHMKRARSSAAEYGYADETALKTFMVNNGMGDILAKSGTNDAAAAQVLNFKTAVSEQIRKMRDSGIKIGPEQEQTAMKRVVADTAMLDINWGRDKERIYGTMTPEEQKRTYFVIGKDLVYTNQISEAERKNIIAGIEAQGDDVTERRIVEEWVEMGGLKRKK
ncbi:Peptidase M23 [uncultured Caudovirales phage]|uniref:Peptidase M23 n=1 Tax=uncultured Caudovirales phage TaxID=2100421 RepID=A0A6J5P697_9CAUD|nr:Peptidase M23 [uncultured Caudovirales phage]